MLRPADRPRELYITTSPARLAAFGNPSVTIADTAVQTWVAVHAALSPVIGEGGFAALYNRTMHLSRVDYPWLAPVHDKLAAAEQFGALHATLAAQADDEASAAHASMTQTIRRLLSSLIGESLTARLLQDISFPSSAGPAVQDPSS